MNVFSIEFVQAVSEKLHSLGDGEAITREKLCEAVGVNVRFVNAISMILQEPEFSDFETVKAKGIRRKKVV